MTNRFSSRETFLVRDVSYLGQGGRNICHGHVSTRPIW